MDLMNAISAKFTKLIGIAMIVGMAAGCASVTDATLADEPVDATTIEQPANPAPANFGDDDVDPIIDKP